jgi:hypothetical protein
MIRLTSYTSGKAISVSPELIKAVIEDENFTYIHFGPDDDYIKVSESREEVARKVLEWRLAMIDYHHDIPSVKTKAMAELAKLAGLEEPNHD